MVVVNVYNPVKFREATGLPDIERHSMVLRCVGTTLKGVIVGGLLRKQEVGVSGRNSGLDLSKYRKIV